MSSSITNIRDKLIEALNNALTATNKPQREHGEKELTQALDQNAAQVLPELILIAGNASLGPVSELAAIRSKNYLLNYTGDSNVWDERIVPSTRLAVFNQLPTASPTARRVLLAALRILLRDDPWPELVDMAAPVLSASTQNALELMNNNNANNQQQLEKEIGTIICALEAMLVMMANFRTTGLIEKEIQNHVSETLLPLLPPLFFLQRTEIVSLVFAGFHSMIASNRPPTLTNTNNLAENGNTEVMNGWMNEMLSFPEKFAGVSQQSRKSFEHYIKAVYNIAAVAIQIVDVTGASPNSNNNNSNKKKGGKNKRSAKRFLPEIPVVYNYGQKFTTFFARFLNYVATTTINSFGSSDNDDRDTIGMMRNPALYSMRFLKNAASQPCAQQLFSEADLQQLVTRDLFAFTPFNEEDADLWEDDPREYLRMISDPESQEVSLRHKATQLIIELCKPRKTRPPLAPLDAVLKGLSDHLRGAGTAPKQADGAMYILANLRDLIRKQPHWWNNVGGMLSELVAPMLNHKSSVVRAKAIWLCGAFSDAPFPEGTSMFRDMVYGVMRMIEDKHPGVRASVVTSVVQFLAQEQARPLVYELLNPIVDECLRLLESVSSESVVLCLRCLVSCFGPELRSSIANICDRLVQTILATHFELTNADDPEDEFYGGNNNNGEGGFEENDDDNAPSARKRRSLSARIDSLSEIIANAMRTLDGALDAMGSNPSLVRQLQPRIGQMLKQLFKGNSSPDLNNNNNNNDDDNNNNEELFDGDFTMIEYAANLMGTALRYCVPPNFSGADPECARRFSSPDEYRAVIAQEFWDCLPLLHRIVTNEGGCDLFSTIAKPMENFIAIIPLEFSDGPQLYRLLQTCEHMIKLIDPDEDDGDDGMGMLTMVTDEQIKGAPLIICTLLEHIRPVGTIPNDQAFSQIVGLLMKGLMKSQKRTALKTSLTVAMLDCFIFDAARTARTLEAGGASASMFVEEFIKFYKAKAKTQFSPSIYRSKVVVLGLIAILKLWIGNNGNNNSSIDSQICPPEGVRAIMEVLVHAIQNEQEANRKWLEKYSPEALEKARREQNNNEVYQENDDDEDDDDEQGDNNNGLSGGVEGDYNEDDDISIDGDDDDGAGNASGNDDDEYDSPLNKINTAGALIDFFSGCPVEILNNAGVPNLISKQDLENCAKVAQQVLDRDKELQLIFEREEEERAAAMMSNSNNNNRK